MSEPKASTRAERILDGLRAGPAASPEALQQEAAQAAARLAASDAVPAIDRYEFHEVLGRGAAAVVYRATDRTLKRPVAVKVLRESFSGFGSLRERFEREASVAAGSPHPGIVTVYDFGESGGKPFLVMELVDGPPLGELIGVHPRDLVRLVSLVEEACRAMAVMHAKGVIHRDLKPANILVSADGHAKISDFGIAHILGGEARLTQTGTVLGTPLYMAPEQVRGATQEISPATDVYALGAILYEILTDRPPHTGESLTEIYDRILREEPPSPVTLNASVPEALQTICLKALDKDPVARYRTAAEMGDDLRRYLAGEPILARPPGRAARTLRWIRRHPGASGAAIVLLSFTAALWVATLRWRDAAGARDRLEFSREQASLLEDGQRRVRLADAARYKPTTSPAEMKSLSDAALVPLLKVIGADPENAEAYALIGQARDLRGEDALAIAAWKKALQHDPDHLRARYFLARHAIIEASMPMLARGAIGRAAAGPAEVVLFDEAGRFVKDLPAERFETADDLLRIHIETARNIVMQGETASYRGAVSAIVHYQDAPRVEDLLWLTNLSIKSVWSLGNLDRALKVRPSNWIVHAIIASRKLGEGKVDEALAAATKAVEYAPPRPDLLVLRARARAANGQLKDAMEDVDRALATAPADWILRAYTTELRVNLATGKNY